MQRTTNKNKCPLRAIFTKYYLVSCVCSVCQTVGKSLDDVESKIADSSIIIITLEIAVSTEK